MEITSVELSDVKVLQEGQNQAMNVIRTLMKSDVGQQLWQKIAPAVQELAAEERHKRMEEEGLDTAPLIDFGQQSTNESQQSSTMKPAIDLEKMVSTLSDVLTPELIEEIDCVYQVDCIGLGPFFMDLKNPPGRIDLGPCPGNLRPDALFRLSADDLLLMLIGQLGPMDAYMSGRVVIEGSTSAALRLKAFSRHVSRQFPSQIAASG